MAPTRERLPGERLFACVMVLLSAFLLWTAVGISGFESTTSAGSFPMAASALMLVCSVIVVAQTARLRPSPAAADESPLGHWARRIAPPVVLKTSGAIVAYMLTLEWLGFIAGSYLFLVETMALLGSRRRGLNLVTSALVLAAIVVVFQTVFSVQLPQGTLWQGLFK